MTALKRPVVKAESLKSNQACTKCSALTSRISSDSSEMASLSRFEVAVALMPRTCLLGLFLGAEGHEADPLHTTVLQVALH